MRPKHSRKMLTMNVVKMWYCRCGTYADIKSIGLKKKQPVSCYRRLTNVVVLPILTQVQLPYLPMSVIIAGLLYVRDVK